jgi:hypothetical protein
MYIPIMYAEVVKEREEEGLEARLGRAAEVFYYYSSLPRPPTHLHQEPEKESPSRCSLLRVVRGNPLAQRQGPAIGRRFGHGKQPIPKQVADRIRDLRSSDSQGGKAAGALARPRARLFPSELGPDCRVPVSAGEPPCPHPPLPPVEMLGSDENGEIAWVTSACSAPDRDHERLRRRAGMCWP